jgi:hypothetical protein
MFNTTTQLDQLASRLTSTDCPFPMPGIDSVVQESYLRCPWDACNCGHKTHIVDVVWERDPRREHRWLRMEVRCEEGRGYLLLIRNHGGKSYFDTVLLDGSVVSPFAEGSRW